MLKLGRMTRFDKLNVVASLCLAAISTMLILIEYSLILLVFLLWCYYSYLADKYSGYVGKKFKIHQYISLFIVFVPVMTLTYFILKVTPPQIIDIRGVRMLFSVLFLNFFMSFMVAAFLNSMIAKPLNADQLNG